MTDIGAENHNLVAPILATLLWIVYLVRRQHERLHLDWPWILAAVAFGRRIALRMRNPDRSSNSLTNAANTARYVRGWDAVNRQPLMNTVHRGAGRRSEHHTRKSPAPSCLRVARSIRLGSRQTLTSPTWSTHSKRTPREASKSRTFFARHSSIFRLSVV